MAPKNFTRGHPFSIMKPTFAEDCFLYVFLSTLGSPLAHFGLPFGSLWLLWGSLWLTFGAHWLTFGSLLVPFVSLLVPSGSLLVPLASLLVTLALDFLTFGASWCYFSYFYTFSMKICCKFIFFRKCSLKFRFLSSFFFETLSAKSPRTIPGTLSFVPVFQGPVRVYCRRQLRSVLFYIRVDRAAHFFDFLRHQI